MIDKAKHYGFMPGCSLASYNPEAVAKTTAYLKSCLPKFSAVLKCCGKPTKDIGQYELFRERFAGLEQDLEEVHVEELILACPNCKAVFEKESNTKVRSLWEILPKTGLPEEVRGKAKDSDMIFTIHDSCSARYDKEAQEGIRWILKELGYQYVESEYSGEKTKCCGFGGQVNPANPDMTRKVMRRRIETLEDYPVVVYCSTCRSAFMQNHVKAWHILDLIWGPVVHMGDEPGCDVLEKPDNVWHNRFETRKQMMKCFE
ncbi:glutamate synthase [Lachnoclostridium sp. An169]|uniref:(Fe-S)-binding protein n=1 Tax=Lachnoclostridium sp. An169 TaxID=1965569 RepID=UPI000B567868|nr:(Fe-S)-binding protein [Lachnoclostridium sp. An169]OUP82930.1 glutamate synthase [Lachnoclostridium sp. An169]